MENAIAMVEAFHVRANQRVQRSKAAILELLRTHEAPFDRSSFDPGHITASAIVLSPDGQSLLLVHHRRLDRWLQPGGHVEPGDGTIVETARREVSEETGVELPETATPNLLGLDVHEIPAAAREPFHLHHDLTFGFVAEPEHTGLSGSEQAVWCAIRQLHSYGVDKPLRASLERALSSTSSFPSSPLFAS